MNHRYMLLVLLSVSLPFIFGCAQPKPSDPTEADIAKDKAAAASVNPKRMTRLAVTGAQMSGDNCGRVDTDGSYMMTSNGSIRAVDLWVNGGINEAVVKAHGAPAGDVWPKIKVRLINTKLAKSFDVAEDLTINTKTGKFYPLNVTGGLPAGNYIAEIFYTNNSEGIPEFSKEDRNVWIDAIILNPNAPSPKDKATTESVSTLETPTTLTAEKASPLSRLGRDMKGDVGKADGTSWLMWSNGKLIAENLYAKKAIKSIKFNAHGSQAAGVWPVIQVRVAHTSSAMLVVAFDSLSVDSATSKVFQKEFDPPLEVGNYNAEFLFQNNSDGIPADSKEDRNVWIDSVELIEL
ncbi:MAG: hypothetical protein PHX74_02470 [Candidatus Sumerlaeales bacterium]|nr:hypothetical protein [Candidatus Sumerlaeales bacterium]